MMTVSEQVVPLKAVYINVQVIQSLVPVEVGYAYRMNVSPGTPSWKILLPALHYQMMVTSSLV
jgi:hypothetical protein